tara:strand:+ start:1395 stop:1577 length:183 start_codon:yes stop_codon:yes gene_type:complete
MKLTPISIEDVTENLYTDYWMDCTDDGETPLEQSEWVELEGVKQSIKNFHSLFGKIREQK